jgi:membrane fusion protein (multidrug efflux system)
MGRAPKEYCLMDVLTPALEDKKATSPLLLKTDNEVRPSQDKAGERERTDTPPAQAPTSSWSQYLRHRPWIVAITLVALLSIIIGGILWWLHARQFESTDDAFIDAHTVAISPQVAGAISELNVNDNQIVKAGTVLARIDDAIYASQLAEAKAQVEQLQANIANLVAQLDAQHSRIDQANKQAAEAQAALAFSQQENTRYVELVRTGAGTEQRAQQAASDLTQKQAAFAGAQANAVTAQKQLLILQTQQSAADAQLKSAEAGQTLAETNLSYTTITAPVAGRVTKLSGAKGTYLQPGQSITMFVPQEVWVTANFKETQLDLMHVGQPVDIAVDAFPDRAFHGHVDSIQAGSGTAFSLLPAENATGNYIKVVQRIPVKIVFDRMPEVELGPGMSVVPTVKVR